MNMNKRNRSLKHVLESMMQSGAWKLILAEIVMSVVSIWINAKILVWISYAMNDSANALHWIGCIVVGCVANTIIDGLIGYSDLSRHILYTHMMERLLNKTLHADPAFFSSMSPGEVSHACGQLWLVTSSVWTGIHMIKYAITVMINLVMIATLAGAWCAPVILVTSVSGLVLYHANNKWNAVDRELDAVKKRRNVELDETVNGFMEVRSFPGTVQYHTDNIIDSNRRIMKLTRRRQFYTGIMNTIVNTSDTISMMIVIGYVLGFGNGTMVLPPATSMALVTYVWRLAEPMCSLVFGFADLSDGMAPLPSINRILDDEPKLKIGHIDWDCDFHEIELDNVGFSYDTVSTILDHINIRVKKGEKIGICGPSGGGKTSLIKLLGRFYDPTAGRILIDSVRIQDIDRCSYLENVGIVHQDAYIFDGTLMDNIVYGRRPYPTSEHDVIEACRKACLWDFIQSLPDGLQTKVGPRGLKLSGGQKQRLSLARVFLTNPKIILLDEATSALDNETEEIVQDALNAMHDKTIIAVAHRLSTIRNCDRIYVIDKHRVVESGTHDELLEKNGVYARLQS